MNPIPVSFYFDFNFTDAKTRPFIMHEFAACGAKHLVLTDALIRMIMKEPSLQETLLREMADEGLSFMDAHAPYGPKLDLNWSVCEQLHPQVVLRGRLALQIAAEMGIKTITFHVGMETDLEFPLDAQFDSVRRSLEELLPTAESLGLTICIENVWFQLNTPERLLAVKQGFPTDALGLCYDAGHANVMAKGRGCPESVVYRSWGETPPQFDDRILEKMLPQIVNCHLHDNHGLHDEHLNIGRGNVNWPHIVALLKQAPRLQVIQSEVFPVAKHNSIHDICARFLELEEL